MRDQLKALEALQKIDLQIAELLKGGAENPKRLAELESQLGAARGAVEAERKKLTELERQKKAVEEQLAADKDKVKKWEARLTEQRSTREYSALAREIDIAKKQNDTAGEEVVELARQRETTRKVVTEREGAFKSAETALMAQMQQIQTDMSDLDSRRKNLDEKRAAAAKHVPPATLRRYDIIQKRRSMALAQVIGGACQGCHMNVPPQLYNELRTNPRMDVCQSCGRMIYSPEPFAEETEES